MNVQRPPILFSLNQRTGHMATNTTKEKSLGIIAFNFLKLLQKEKTLTIERAAEILSQNLEPNKYKTKVLYHYYYFFYYLYYYYLDY